MPSITLSLLIDVLISGFIAWIWIDYYRLIGVYGKKKLKYIIPAFVFGAVSTLLVIAVNKYILDYIPPYMTRHDELLNVLSYCVFKIGFVEESAKIALFVIFYFVFRSQFKEPLDYLAFASVIALGFAAVENVMYFLDDGAIIYLRAIMSSIAHMFYTMLMVYGIVLVKYKKVKHKTGTILLYAIMAVVAHALNDFVLLYKNGTILILLDVFGFFYIISIFAIMFNNALNNASNFSYKTTVNSNKVASHILIYYLVVLIVQFLVNEHNKGMKYAYTGMITNAVISGIVLGSMATRLARYRLIMGHWQPLTLELPFRIVMGNSLPGSQMVGIYFRGESVTEGELNKYYNEYFTINPISKRSAISKPIVAYIDKRIFGQNDVAFHVTKLYTDDAQQEYTMVLLRPKLKDTIMFEDKYPIVGVFKYKDMAGVDESKLTVKDFNFIEWAYIKPLQP